MTARNILNFPLAFRLPACCWPLLAGVWVVALGSDSSFLFAQGMEGNCPKLSGVLRKPISARWRGQELGHLVGRLEPTTGLKIWLDRRVDPQQKVELVVLDQPLGEVLLRLADGKNWSVSCGAGVVYIGPRNAVGQFRTLLELSQTQIAHLPPATQEIWKEQGLATWDRLTEPRQFLLALLTERGIQLRNENLVPHDLLPAQDLPSLQLHELVTIVLQGFDLGFNLTHGGKVCVIQPLPSQVVLTRRYSLNGAQRRRWRPLRSQFNKFVVSQNEGDLEIAASWEVHHSLQQVLNGSSKSQTKSPTLSGPHGKSVFSLKLQNQPLGPVMRNLSRQLGFSLQWNEDETTRTASQKKLVSCDLNQVELPELLEGILTPAGLTYRLDDKSLTIQPLSNGK